MVDLGRAAGLQFCGAPQVRPSTRSGTEAHRAASSEPAYEAIEMPRNSPAGFIAAFFATFMGFALICTSVMVILGFLAAVAVVLIAGWSTEREQKSRPPSRGHGTARGMIQWEPVFEKIMLTRS
jgi:hypothetical protein